MFKGSMVALVTPFKNGKIDFASLRKLIDFHLENGTDVIVPCGTTGESATMSHDEHKSVLTYVVEYINHRIPVICGAGSNNTEEAIELVRHAKKIGGDGVLVVTPYYNKPTQEGLFRHYEYLAKKVDIPFVLYNVPGRTGVSLAPETAARLSKFDNIVAVKEASGNLDAVSQIISSCSLTVLSGEDSLTMPMLALGAQGAISVTANVVPDLSRRMIHAYLDGDLDESRDLHYKMFPLAKVLFVETNPIPVKTALAMMGKIREEFRLPLCEMSKENREKVRKVIADLGLIPAGKRVKI
ncbi:MAG: 4-hydroxy-tetrahydrodipicolinate synthase [Candidatus Omnitrophica bacterium]|nr:4-hydroxy-tetrahydrodipicolinate synthase [Candidatus Omnitrophota bacterium]